MNFKSCTMKTMFRIVLISIILGSAGPATFAQRHMGPDPNMEKFKAMKISKRQSEHCQRLFLQKK